MAAGMGALSRFSAARRRFRRYATGGQVEDDDYSPPSYDEGEEPGRYIEGLDDPDVAAGSGALTKAASSNPYIQRLADTASAFPNGAGIAGALNDRQAAVDRARQEQSAAILSAMRNIQNAGDGSTNMPLFMAASGLLGPTRTGSFGESISNAAQAAAPEILRERALQRENTLAAGQLGVQAAGVGVEQASGDLSDFYRQIGLGEKFQSDAAVRQYYEDTLAARAKALAAQNAARQAVATTNADARVQAATIMAKPRLEQADVAAMRDNIQYLGPKAGDPNTGLYLDRFHNVVKEGPASTGTGAATSKEMQDLQFMVTNHIAPDLTTAYAMRRSGVNDAATFQRLIQQEKNILLKTPQGSTMNDAELESQARENVVSRQSMSRGAGPGLPAPAAPAPPGAAPAPATPPPAKAIRPPRPSGVPPTARFSPSQNAYWWQDSAGKWQHAAVQQPRGQ